MIQHLTNAEEKFLYKEIEEEDNQTFILSTYKNLNIWIILMYCVVTVRFIHARKISNSFLQPKGRLGVVFSL